MRRKFAIVHISCDWCEKEFRPGHIIYHITTHGHGLTDYSKTEEVCGDCRAKHQIENDKAAFKGYPLRKEDFREILYK